MLSFFLVPQNLSSLEPLKEKKMKTIFSLLKLTLLTVILFAVIYPLAIYGIAQFAPNHGKGETITVNGKVVGYQKIGQKFDKSNYF